MEWGSIEMGWVGDEVPSLIRSRPPTGNLPLHPFAKKVKKEDKEEDPANMSEAAETGANATPKAKKRAATDDASTGKGPAEKDKKEDKEKVPANMSGTLTSIWRRSHFLVSIVVFYHIQPLGCGGSNHMTTLSSRSDLYPVIPQQVRSPP